MARILSYLKPIRKYVVLSVIFVLLAQGMTLLLPLLMSFIINNGIKEGDVDYIKRFGAYMAAVSVLGVVISILNSYFTARTSTLYGRLLREKVFLKVESLSQCDIDKLGTPSLITRSTNDVSQLQDFVLMGMRMILAAPILLVGGTVMAFAMNARLAMTIFLVLPVIALIILLVVKLVIPLFKQRQKKVDALNHLVREKFTGVRVIRAFNRSDFEDERFDVSNRELANLAQKIARIFSVLIPTCIALVFSGVCGLIWVAAKNIDSMNALTEAAKISNTVGDLQAFIMYMIMIVAAVTMAGAMFVIVPRATISAKRILEVLDLVPEITPPEKPLTVEGSERGVVRFEDVSFGYPGAEDGVLRNVSFTAMPGEMTAVIGGTGSGKSTLINLIPRFYDVTAGSVTLDGVDVRAFSEKDLHSRIGFIPQTATLFSGTIEENLRFGKEDATEQELWEALRIAKADGFVRELPEGLQSRVSQSGTNLSGGQKQRLAIARAMVKKAEVYIFDDSFSALDFRTDAQVRQALSESITDAAVIVVAQRVGTILNAEKIIVLDKGEVVGVGTHRQLMESCQVYREIAKSQLSPEEL